MNHKGNFIYTIFGVIALTLGIIGIVLPLLPTTPFVLLAAGCFAKSSPRFYQFLYNHKFFGPMIKQWQEQHCISRKNKTIALVSMFLFGAASIIFAIKILWVKILGYVLITIGCCYVLRIPTCENCKKLTENPDATR